MEHGALRHHRQEGAFDGTHATEIQRDKVAPPRRGMSHSIRRKWARRARQDDSRLRWIRSQRSWRVQGRWGGPEGVLQGGRAAGRDPLRAPEGGPAVGGPKNPGGGEALPVAGGPTGGGTA